LDSLLAQLQVVGADDGVRVVVLTAAGEIFCSGANLKELADPTKVARLSELVGQVVVSLVEMPKPVLCRVTGDAYGAGLAILSSSDIAIADDRARFSIAEVRFGMVPTVAAACSSRLISLGASLDLMLTGRRFGAGEAQRLGFITETVESPELDAAVGSRVDDLLLGDQRAIGLTKRMVRDLYGPTLAQSIEAAKVSTGSSTSVLPSSVAE
jgi:methylglutaconyl-CoA hydratase